MRPCLENILSVHPNNYAGTWTLNLKAKAVPNQDRGGDCLSRRIHGNMYDVGIEATDVGIEATIN